MKDIDFDELDKAVSSVLAPSGPVVPESTPVAEKPVAAEPVLSPAPSFIKSRPMTATPDISGDDAVSQSSPDANSEKPADEPLQEKKPTPNIAPRRGGRFMDMVHTDTVTKNPVSPAMARARVTVRPTVAGQSLAAPVLDTSTLDTVEQEPVEEQAQVWPDPIEVTSAPNSSTSSADTSSELAPMNDWFDDDHVEAIKAEVTEDDVSSSNTPFLSDAKVEKRPLGQFSDAPSEDENADVTNEMIHATRLYDEPEQSDEQRDDIQQHEEAVAPAKTLTGDRLPRELEGDIVAIESSSAQEPAKNPTAPAKQEASTAESVVSAATAMAIPKQYRESSETPASSTHTLFDTDEYHPPITKYGDSHSHRHVALWVIVALLLLIATAAGFGYWLYLQI